MCLSSSPRWGCLRFGRARRLFFHDPMGGKEQNGRELAADAILDALESGESERIVSLVREAHPGDVELAFDRLESEDRGRVLDQLPAAALSAWADHLCAADLERGLSTRSDAEQREVLQAFSDDELVDFLQDVGESTRTRYIALLDPETRRISEELLRYPEDSAGGRMTQAVAVVPEDRRVGEALDELAQLPDEAVVDPIYVVSEDRRLLGKLSLRGLAFAPRDELVSQLMDADPIAIHALADQEEAAWMVARYSLYSLPVVDEEGRLLGVITHDDALEILETESTEDMERISGIGGSSGVSYLQTSPYIHLRRRFGWILVLAFLALSSGLVLHAFEDILTRHYILALYLPMVVAAGGNTGAQSATMVIRAMSVGELSTREFGRVVWKEGRIGLMLGALLGASVALSITLFLTARPGGASPGALAMALVVGGAILLQIMTSTLIGASLPLAAKRLRLDPAVVASPVITTLVDVTGSVIYFGLASLLLG